MTLLAARLVRLKTRMTTNIQAKISDGQTQIDKYIRALFLLEFDLYLIKNL